VSASRLSERPQNLETIWLVAGENDESLQKFLRDVDKLYSFDRLITLVLDRSIDRTFMGHRNFLPYDNVLDWVLHLDTFENGLVLQPHMAHDNPDGMRFALFMNSIHKVILDGIHRLIEDSILVGRMPPKGVVLYFTEDLSARFLIAYDANTGLTRISFVEHFPDVKAFFDVAEIKGIRTARGRDKAKSFIQSGHKALIHLGVFTHVDRRRHFGVFGPSIDTLLMARLVADYARSESPASVLEVGVGSGHILAVALLNCQFVAHATGLDIEPFSIICAHENLSRTKSTSLRPLDKLDLSLIIGSFAKEKFGRKFDLIICNPPYVAHEMGDRSGADSEYGTATMGLDLIEQLLGALPDILSDGGRCLMMVSTASLGFEAMVPKCLSAIIAPSADRVRVPFDIEAANDEQRRIDYLLREGGIERAGDGSYTHELRPYWIKVKQ
jgi:methylase of polypeptide subunit release factors